MAVVINTVTSTDKLSLINANFSTLAAAINDSLLWRNGNTAGETLLTRDVDFNSKSILNAYVGGVALSSLLESVQEQVGIAESYSQAAADSASSAAAYAVNAANSAWQAAQTAENAVEEIQEILDAAGEQSTLVVLAQSSSTTGDALVAHSRNNTTYESPRTVKDLLNEIPSIMSFNSSSTTDDTERFTNAIAAGHKHVFVPGREEIGRDIVVSNLLITTPFYIYGVGGKNIDSYNSVISVKTGSTYGIRFEGATSSRPHGGGIINCVVKGASASDSGDLIQAQTWSYLQFTGNGFNNRVGWGITLKDIAESTIDNNLFRRLGSDTTGCIKLDSYLTSTNNNVNNLKITNNTFGLNSGDWISGVSNSNTDLIWITGNKFEYDSTPTSANVSSHSVINLQNTARTFILENGFAHFRSSNNLYSDVIYLGTSCTLRQNISNNEFYGCDGNLWNAVGGSIYARGNTANQADASTPPSISVTSSRNQDIISPSFHSSNSNKNKRSDYNSAAWSSSHDMWGTVNNTFTADPGAGSVVLTAMSVAASAEIRRGTVPLSLVVDKSFVHITARVKNTTTTAGTITLTVDGVSQGVKTTATDTNWHYYTWQVRPDAISSGLFILTNGAQAILFDGVFVEKKDYYDWGFSWTPGAIAANSFATSPVQSLTDTTGVFCGQVLATANNVTNGCIVYASVAPSGNVTVYCANPTTSSITPSFTGVRLRYHLV